MKDKCSFNLKNDKEHITNKEYLIKKNIQVLLNNLVSFGNQEEKTHNPLIISCNFSYFI